MGTRTIVTSQPDVACDLCERRLLRGEQPDIFLAAGRRRIVCELCAPRAAYEGWQRESDSQSLNLPPMRPRRGRGLLERLRARQLARPNGDEEERLGASVGEQASQPYDVFADASAPAGHDQHMPTAVAPAADLAQGPPHGSGETNGAPVADAPFEQAGSETAAPQDASVSYMHEAIAVFNASEFPRRVAGVARSLGAPSVSVRSAEHLSSVVSIVVAWELCWYRYEVDLSEPVVEAQMIAQGTELDELARDDRLANAAAAESGSLALSTL